MLEHDLRNSKRKARDQRLAHQPARRGVAVLFVFLLLAITFGLSYAAIRSQSISATIQRNADRGGNARHAAITGLMMALKKMQIGGANGWSGIGTTLSGQVNQYETFQATYTTGDPRLVSGQPDYDDYPFRVTVISTGSASNAGNSSAVSIWQSRAIVRLVPRKLGPEPTNWWTDTYGVKGRAIFQSNTGDFKLNNPVRINGTLRAQGAITLAGGVGWSETIKRRYFGDLKTMYQNGMPNRDWRLITGRVDLPIASQPGNTIAELNALGNATSNLAAQAVVDSSYPLQVLSYRLYPGGKVYNTTAIPQQPAAGTRYGADPLGNPAGIFFRAGPLQLVDNVVVAGTLITQTDLTGDVEVTGRNITISPVNLPALCGTTDAVQLPALVCGDEVYVRENAKLEIKGMTCCRNKFEVVSDNQSDIELNCNGPVVAGAFWIRARSDWIMSSDSWDNLYDWYKWWCDWSHEDLYFADWLFRFASSHLSGAAQLNFNWPSTGYRYHWHNPADPIYVVDTDRGDPGLRWEVIDWKDSL